MRDEDICVAIRTVFARFAELGRQCRRDRLLAGAESVGCKTPGLPMAADFDSAIPRFEYPGAPAKFFNELRFATSGLASL